MKILKKRIATWSIFALASLGAYADYTIPDYELVKDGSGDFSIVKYELQADGTYAAVTYGVTFGTSDVGDSTGENGIFYYNWDSTTNSYVVIDSTTYEDEPDSYDIMVTTNSGRDGSLTNAEVLDKTDQYYVIANKSPSTQGGALLPSGNITSGLNVVLIGNAGIATSSTAAYGGAISLTGKSINSTLTGLFVSNYVSSDKSKGAAGGAIHVGSSYNIDTIYADFIGNYAINTNSSNNAQGGAINNSNTIGKIEGDFIANYTSSVGGVSQGGAISGGATYIEGNFLSNYSISTSGTARGGAVYNTKATSFYAVTDDRQFTANYVESGSGAAQGGAIGNTYDGLNFYSTDYDLIFASNSATSDSGTARGGAIYNTGTIVFTATNSNLMFLDNYAESTTSSGSALGGAIDNTGTITFNATNSNILFSGNYVQDYEGNKTSSAISNTTGTINFNGDSNSTITFNDSITGNSDWMTSFSFGYLNINSGTVAFNNSLNGQYVNVLSGATLQLGTYNGVSASVDSYIGLNSGSTLSIAISEATASMDLTSAYFINGYVGESALDLSDIFGDFTMVIEFENGDTSGGVSGQLFYDFLNSDLAVIFTDTTTGDVVGSIDENNENLTTYVVTSLDGSLLAEFEISYDDLSYDITITGTSYIGAAVPEPSTYATIFGILALGLAYYRRKK